MCDYLRVQIVVYSQSEQEVVPRIAAIVDDPAWAGVALLVRDRCFVRAALAEFPRHSLRAEHVEHRSEYFDL